MKIRNFFKKPTFLFLSGMLLGMAVLSSFAFINNDSAEKEQAGIQQINVEAASLLTQSYYANARAMNAILQGFSVNMDQLSAMNTIAEENSGLSGFKIYMGSDQGTNVGVVVGVNSQGKDAISNSIYKTSVSNSGACPQICDSASPLSN